MSTNSVLTPSKVRYTSHLGQRPKMRKKSVVDTLNALISR